MRLSRALSRSSSRLLIGILLFAQFAVASYACPGLKGMGSTATGVMGTVVLSAAADTTSAAEPADMPLGCDQIDPNAANLCAEHCHQGQQSADTAAAPVVGLTIPTFLYSLRLEPQNLLGFGRSFPAPDASLDAAPEPPHAILHCVFRT
ncbi:MAG: hypothetical protein ABI887_05470 [Burkholderiales bacterium]